jgi:hypothetical protein
MAERPWIELSSEELRCEDGEQLTGSCRNALPARFSQAPSKDLANALSWDATGADASILTSYIIITLSCDVTEPGRIGSVFGIPLLACPAFLPGGRAADRVLSSCPAPDIRLQPIPALTSYTRRFSLLAGGVHIGWLGVTSSPIDRIQPTHRFSAPKHSTCLRRAHSG